MSIFSARFKMGDAIKVFVRVRPPGGDDKETDRCLTVDSEHNAIIVKVKPDPKIFTYDQVADTEVTQVCAIYFQTNESE